MISLKLKINQLGDYMFFFYFFAIFIILIGLAIHIRSNSNSSLEQGETDIREAWEFIKKYGGNHTSHLHLLNDKQFYWAIDGQILITYQKIGRTYVVLGDPIGDIAYISEAIKEFEKITSKNIVFYQVSSDFLENDAINEYQAIKLGEEAKLSLTNFSLEGKFGAKLRTRKNKFERNGYTFKVLFPDFSDELLTDIQEISNSWLGTRKEKSFSVGFFCKSYINRFPIAVLYNPDGRMIAFATLASNYRERNRTITIDLMRYEKESPHGTMDMLFLSIFNWCKEQGYDWCSMGMAPLANLYEAKSANKAELIGQYIFHKGNQFYNFKGLYEYKNKFRPIWESRYLVYRRNALLLVLVNLIRLIHQKPSPKQLNVVRKWMEKAS
jgi:phosphatidylglycerol lysyltransferase